MSATWGDLNARARGLATHLASRPTLEQLAESPTLAALARDCVATGVLPAEPEQPAPFAFELAFRRVAALQLKTLIRWMGPRTEALRFLLEDEDRRSLRALLRGAAAGVAAETRLAGLIPTPSLPERLLTELARQPRCRDAVALLVASGMSNREAAAALFISRKTVEYHLVKVYKKLNVRSRVQLVHTLGGAA